MISERSFAHSFDSFWHELLPLLTPRFVTLFNEAFEVFLKDTHGNWLDSISSPAEVERHDIVAEFGFRLAAMAHRESLDFEEVNNSSVILNEAEAEAFKLIERYEGFKPVEVEPLSEHEKAEGLRLCHRYKAIFSCFQDRDSLEFCPKFAGAGFLQSCEGDMAVEDCLIEVKTTSRKVSGKDLRQLIVYAALDAASGSRRWSSIAIFNPRRGTLHKLEIDSLILSISGGKPRADVFAELLSFVESNGPVIDTLF